MASFFDDGLETYHVRKPAWTQDELAEWIAALPGSWRPRLVVHQHGALVERLGLKAFHQRDAGAAAGGFSRSCHSLEGLRSCLGRYRRLVFGPVFDSITKRGYGPPSDFSWDALAAVLRARPGAPSTEVLAVGGVTAARIPSCRRLGFDGVALMGAVWSAREPAAVFRDVVDAASRQEAATDAA